MGDEGEASTLHVVEGSSDEGGVSAPHFANEHNQVAFPDVDDEGDDDMEPAIRFKELAANEWYRVKIVKELNTKFGITKLLTLRDREMNRLTVWPTKLILESIDKKWNERRDGGSLFIRPLGKNLVLLATMTLNTSLLINFHNYIINSKNSLCFLCFPYISHKQSQIPMC